MNRHAKRLITLTAAVAVLGPVASQGLTYYVERTMIDTFESVAESVDPTFRDYTTDQTFADGREWAEFKNLPIADAMDASAADIDDLVDLAVAADMGLTLDNSYERMQERDGTMSSSIFADLGVEGCRLVEDFTTFDATQRRAAALCEHLTDRHVEETRHFAWLQASVHFRRACEARHAIVPRGAEQSLVEAFRERTKPSASLNLIVPEDAVEAGDPGALKAKPIAERWLARIEDTATKDACLAHDPDLAEPMHVNDLGYLVVGSRDTAEQG